MGESVWTPEAAYVPVPPFRVGLSGNGSVTPRGSMRRSTFSDEDLEEVVTLRDMAPGPIRTSTKNRTVVLWSRFCLRYHSVALTETCHCYCSSRQMPSRRRWCLHGVWRHIPDVVRSSRQFEESSRHEVITSYGVMTNLEQRWHQGLSYKDRVTKSRPRRHRRPWRPSRKSCRRCSNRKRINMTDFKGLCRARSAGLAHLHQRFGAGADSKTQVARGAYCLKALQKSSPAGEEREWLLWQVLPNSAEKARTVISEKIGSSEIFNSGLAQSSFLQLSRSLLSWRGSLAKFPREDLNRDLREDILHSDLQLRSFSCLAPPVLSLCGALATLPPLVEVLWHDTHSMTKTWRSGGCKRHGTWGALSRSLSWTRASAPSWSSVLTLVTIHSQCCGALFHIGVGLRSWRRSGPGSQRRQAALRSSTSFLQLSRTVLSLRRVLAKFEDVMLVGELARCEHSLGLLQRAAGLSCCFHRSISCLAQRLPWQSQAHGGVYDNRDRKRPIKLDVLTDAVASQAGSRKKQCFSIATDHKVLEADVAQHPSRLRVASQAGSRKKQCFSIATDHDNDKVLEADVAQDPSRLRDLSGKGGCLRTWRTTLSLSLWSSSLSVGLWGVSLCSLTDRHESWPAPRQQSSAFVVRSFCASEAISWQRDEDGQEGGAQDERPREVAGQSALPRQAGQVPLAQCGRLDKDGWPKGSETVAEWAVFWTHTRAAQLTWMSSGETTLLGRTCCSEGARWIRGGWTERTLIVQRRRSRRTESCLTCLHSYSVAWKSATFLHPQAREAVRRGCVEVLRTCPGKKAFREAEIAELRNRFRFWVKAKSLSNGSPAGHSNKCDLEHAWYWGPRPSPLSWKFSGWGLRSLMTLATLFSAPRGSNSLSRTSRRSPMIGSSESRFRRARSRRSSHVQQFSLHYRVRMHGNSTGVSPSRSIITYRLTTDGTPRAVQRAPMWKECESTSRWGLAFFENVPASPNVYHLILGFIHVAASRLRKKSPRWRVRTTLRCSTTLLKISCTGTANECHFRCSEHHFVSRCCERCRWSRLIFSDALVLQPRAQAGKHIIVCGLFLWAISEVRCVWDSSSQCFGDCCRFPSCLKCRWSTRCQASVSSFAWQRRAHQRATEDRQRQTETDRRAVLRLARWVWDGQMVICLLSAAGVSRAVHPRDASLMTAYDPMGGGWDEKVKDAVVTADGVHDIARDTAIDGALLAGRIVDEKLNKATIDLTGVSAERIVPMSKMKRGVVTTVEQLSFSPSKKVSRMMVLSKYM